MSFRPGRASKYLLFFLLTSSPVSLSQATNRIHGFEVLLHYRLPGGTEETSRLENFRFVYYERRFAEKPAGFGKPGKLQIRDIPHDMASIQNEEGKKTKFKKLVSLGLEYREMDGKRTLTLIATLKGKGKPVAIWPASSLRNTSIARLPHFRGEAGGKVVDVPLPPLIEAASSQEKILTAIDFQFPGRKKHRDWF